MSDFTALILNEHIKIYRRVRTWIMLFILAGISVLMPVLFYLTGGQSSDFGVWDSFQVTLSLAFILNTIFTIVVASDSVAGEFSWGTIKLLLIRPWSRSKILLSKYLSLILFSLASTVLMIALNYITSAIFFSGTASELATAPSGWSITGYSLMLVVCRYIELFLILTLTFMLSAVFRTSSLAIGLSLFLVFTKSIFNAIFNPERYEWAKYLLFTHLDLSVYLVNKTGLGGTTLGFSVAVLAAYYIVFMLLAWFVFRKRDVAA
ncbi:ABC transporter permease [Paenibacillus sp. sgz500958]|uniref:ABC transporter permease n=1 Tax=Paenibacillus sp. sgz500958 TaxID=3242475 RepID=UPI0036D40AC7